MWVRFTQGATKECDDEKLQFLINVLIYLCVVTEAKGEGNLPKLSTQNSDTKLLLQSSKIAQNKSF